MASKNTIAETDSQAGSLARFETSRRLRWAETEWGGQVHFANYIRLMEETEYAFLRSRGLCVVLHDERGTIGFPRLRAQCEVIRPARFDERLWISLELMQADFKTIEYRFEIVDEQAALVALGHFRAACCRFPENAPPYAILTPEHVLDSLLSNSTDKEKSR